MSKAPKPNPGWSEDVPSPSDVWTGMSTERQRRFGGSKRLREAALKKGVLTVDALTGMSEDAALKIIKRRQHPRPVLKEN